MRVISFDVGIKNMAYCIFDVEETQSISQYPTIVDWNVWNLCAPNGAPESTVPIQTCTQCLKNKKICGKVAKYTQTKQSVIPIEKAIQEYSCEKHAKEHPVWKMPQKEFSSIYLKKQSLEKIKTLRETYIATSSPSLKMPKKMEMIEELVAHFESRTWKWLDSAKKSNKKLNAGTVDLITIGRALYRMLSTNPYCQNGSITHVLIENQISPIANRMKTIQGMLAQHFISLGVSHIEFVSSGNKLREFEEKSDGKTAYQKHKKDGVYYCTEILNGPMVDRICNEGESSSEIERSRHWQTFFSQYGSKKDDLADCFLQGIWWWKTKILPIQNPKKNI